MRPEDPCRRNEVADLCNVVMEYQKILVYR